MKQSDPSTDTSEDDPHNNGVDVEEDNSCDSFSENQVCNDADFQSMLSESEEKLEKWINTVYPRLPGKGDANSLFRRTMTRKWRTLTGAFTGFWNGEKGNNKCLDKSDVPCLDVCFESDWNPCRFLANIQSFIEVCNILYIFF